LRFLGVKRALLVLPVLITVAAGGMFAAGTLVAAFVLRATDGALRHSLHKTTTELLFLPLAEEARRRAKPVIDLIAQRGGQAFSATLVLALVELGARGRTLALATASFAIVWVALATLIGAPYVDAFRQRLKKGAIDIDDRIPELDLGALEALFAALNSARDAEVMGALDLLAKLGRVRLIPALVLYHPSTAVVLRALPHFVGAGRTDFLPIAKRLLDHVEPEVRAAALRARAKIAADPIELAEYAHDARPELRATALVALLALNDQNFVETCGALRQMIADADRLVQLSVVRALGAEPAPSLFEELAELAHSATDADVRGEAATALGRLAEAHPERMPEVLDVLARLLPARHVAVSARAALASLGAPALAFLERQLQDVEQRGPIAWAITRALAGFEPALVVPVLHRQLETSPDGAVRYRALRQLRRLKSEAPTVALDVELLTRVALRTMKDAIWFIEQKSLLAAAQAREGLTATAASALLLALFDDKLTLTMGRLFILVGLVHPQEDFERVARGLSSKDRKTRATSRELCDNVLVAPLREPLLLLIDDRDDEAKLDQALGRERTRTNDYTELVRGLTAQSGELGALSRYRAGEISLDADMMPTSADAASDDFAARIAAARPNRAGREALRG
jgi:ATP:ADP antiporter, AAA family